MQLFFGLTLDRILLIAAAAIIVAILAVISWKNRYRIKYWISMALGRAVFEQYLVYQDDEYDEKNPPRNRHKADTTLNLVLAIVLLSYGAVVILMFISPALLIPLIAIVASLVIFILLWRELMVIREVKKYGPAMHLKVFYKTVDGREGYLFLSNVLTSDRMTIAPLELTAQLEKTEYVIRSGIDERKLEAEISKKYLSEEYIKKLKTMQELTDEEFKIKLGSMKAVDFLRHYFEFGEDPPENYMSKELMELLNDLKTAIEALKIPDSILEIIADEETKYPDLNPAKQMIRSIPLKESLSKSKTRGVTVDETEQIVFDAAKIINSYFITDEELEEDDIGFELFQQGVITPKVREMLKEAYQKAKEQDNKLIEKIKSSDLVRRYMATSIPLFSGEADTLYKYEPHIYTFYPDGDLRRRCIIVFPAPFGECVKVDDKIPVMFDYAEFPGLGGVIEAVRLDPIQEILLQGGELAGNRVILPDDMFGLSVDIPLLICTDCDLTDELTRRGLRRVRPPAEIGMFAQVILNINNTKMIMDKLQKSLQDNARMQDDKEEDEIDKEAELAKIDPSLGGLIDPKNLPTREVIVEKPFPLWKIGIIFGAGIFIGAVALYAAIRLLGHIIV